jgi:hypothetical protein
MEKVVLHLVLQRMDSREVVKAKIEKPDQRPFNRPMCRDCCLQRLSLILYVVSPIYSR